jgi:sugar phosphate permease
LSGPLPIFRRRAVAVPKAAVGNALGWAALAAVITAAAAGSTPEGAAALLGGLHWGLWSAIAFAVLALMLVVVSCAPQAAVNQKIDRPSPRNELRVRLR